MGLLSARVGKNQRRNASLCCPAKPARIEQWWNDMGSLWFWKLFQIFAYECWKNLALWPQLKHSGLFRERSWVPGLIPWWYVTFFRLARPVPFGIYPLDMQVSGFTPTTQHCQFPQGGRGGIHELTLQAGCCTSTHGKAGTGGPRGNTEFPRVRAKDVGTPGETTLLQAQFLLGTIKTGLEGTRCQPTPPALLQD